MQYQWQARYRFSQVAQFGLQGFGEFGKWNDWNPKRLQSHRIGPAFAGEALVGKHAWKYELSYFIGKVRASPAKTVSVRIQATS
ncbi:hypothetical protein [Noviherbaspirillum galbum]|uniref:Uncharacterized protein n=1 Tax=Noviherbaspirillum galbum TaxID=2709383 RepID=A0A6B3SN24_9BURK|nr:hypothetical protein [Noviherbaspirillum galbum]NEX62214.1 hypothetical protein [Noviherbaspirillum galbum]